MDAAKRKSQTCFLKRQLETKTKQPSEGAEVLLPCGSYGESATQRRRQPRFQSCPSLAMTVGKRHAYIAHVCSRAKWWDLRLTRYSQELLPWIIIIPSTDNCKDWIIKCGWIFKPSNNNAQIRSYCYCHYEQKFLSFLCINNLSATC